jgi:MerR family transcriptional regulator, light-induced transcriptional regulator
MQDHHTFLSRRSPKLGKVRRDYAGGLADVAHWALELLAARRASAVPRLRKDLFEMFSAAVTDPDEARLGACLAHLVRERVGAAEVADLYIPELARWLGAEWMDDRLSFVQVSLASARLQALLRAIGCAWSADAAAPGDDRAVVLVVPQGEDHSLGAMVLSGQLRRLGVTVRLALGPDPGEVAEILRAGRMAGVFISVSGTGQLAKARELVEEVRRFGPQGIPVVVGGVLLQANIDAARRLGADLVTSDLHAALEACRAPTEAEYARKGV